MAEKYNVSVNVEFDGSEVSNKLKAALDFAQKNNKDVKINLDTKDFKMNLEDLSSTLKNISSMLSSSFTNMGMSQQASMVDNVNKQYQEQLDLVNKITQTKL